MTKMKSSLIILTSIIILSCDQSLEKETDNKNLYTNPQVEQFKKYLSQKKLYDFVQKSKPIKLSSTFPSPFDTLDFNKVIAYDFDGKEEGYANSIRKMNSNFFSDVVLRQRAVQEKEIQFLLDFLSDPKTYGEVTMACFEPHLGIVFFKDKQVKYVIDICMDCNYLISTSELPASVYKKMKMENGSEYGLNGFSSYGRNKIIELSKKLGLDYGKLGLQK